MSFASDQVSMSTPSAHRHRADNTAELDQITSAVTTSRSTIPPNASPSLVEQQRQADQNHKTVGTAEQHTTAQGQGIDVRALQAEIRALRTDNDQLRALFVDSSLARQPKREEQFYSQDFRQLLADVETWVAKLDRSGGTQELPTDRATEIIKRLREIGQWGAKSGDYWEKNNTFFQLAYRTARSRVQLQRHIVATILFDKVFVPIVFGIPPFHAQEMGRLARVVETIGNPKTNC